MGLDTVDKTQLLWAWRCWHRIEVLGNLDFCTELNSLECGISIGELIVLQSGTLHSLLLHSHCVHHRCFQNKNWDFKCWVWWQRFPFTGHRFRPIHDFGYVALDIIDLIAEDSGTYTCRAVNLVGADETTCTLICRSKRYLANIKVFILL
jgi:hypothetical protein